MRQSYVMNGWNPVKGNKIRWIKYSTMPICIDSVCVDSNLNRITQPHAPQIPERAHTNRLPYARFHFHFHSHNQITKNDGKLNEL